MNLTTLQEEAERLARPAQLLCLEGEGGAVAWSYAARVDGVELAVCHKGKVLTINPHRRGASQVTVVDRPPSGGTPLFGRAHKSLPPIEGVFMFGSDAIGRWLAENNWEREWGYNDNFTEAALVGEYEAWWQRLHPFYSGQGVALAGGWHLFWPDDDWYDLVESELVVWTLRGEPWLEVWAERGCYRVIERAT